MLRLRILLDVVIAARKRRRLNASNDGLGGGFTRHDCLLVGAALVEAALRVLTNQHALIILLIRDVTLVHLVKLAYLVTVALRRAALSSHLDWRRILN